MIDRTPPEAVLVEGVPSLLRSVPENNRNVRCPREEEEEDGPGTERPA